MALALTAASTTLSVDHRQRASESDDRLLRAALHADRADLRVRTQARVALHLSDPTHLRHVRERCAPPVFARGRRSWRRLPRRLRVPRQGLAQPTAEEVPAAEGGVAHGCPSPGSGANVERGIWSKGDEGAWHCVQLCRHGWELEMPLENTP